MATPFTNQATLTYNDQVTASNIVTGVLQEVLTATKRALNTNYRPGDTLTYAISIVNAGNVAQNGLTITDNLAAYPLPGVGTTTLYPLTYVLNSAALYIGGVPQPAPTVTQTEPLTITGINVPANGNVLLIYTAEVNQYAPQGVTGILRNTATITGPGITTPITVTAAAAADTAPNLNVIKAINPTTVVENEPLTYTFTIQNIGATGTTAQDDVTLRDEFDPPLTIQTVTLNGQPLTEGRDYTYDGGVFTTTTPILVPAATYTQDATTGLVSVQPGLATLVVTGTL